MQPWQVCGWYRTRSSVVNTAVPSAAVQRDPGGQQKPCELTTGKCAVLPLGRNNRAAARLAAAPPQGSWSGEELQVPADTAGGAPAMRGRRRWRTPPGAAPGRALAAARATPSLRAAETPRPGTSCGVGSPDSTDTHVQGRAQPREHPWCSEGRSAGV